MTIKIIKGEVKINGEYYGAGAVLKDIASTADEKWLIKEGYAEAIEVSDDAVDIEKMTEKELKVFAAENGFDITGVKGKPNIKAKILELMAASEDDGDDEDDDGGAGGGDA